MPLSRIIIFLLLPLFFVVLGLWAIICLAISHLTGKALNKFFFDGKEFLVSTNKVISTIGVICFIPLFLLCIYYPLLGYSYPKGTKVMAVIAVVGNIISLLCFFIVGISNNKPENNLFHNKIRGNHGNDKKSGNDKMI